MSRLAWTIPALMALLAACPGCLGVTAALALLLLQDGAGDDLPPVIPMAVLEGPTIPLETVPPDLVLGHFVPDPDGERHLDAAVISSDEQIRILRGDGTGRLSTFRDVQLLPDASFPQKLAVIDSGAGVGTLLVATANTLQSIHWNEDDQDFDLEILSDLSIEIELRDMVVGNFDGKGPPDVAVSSSLNEVVEIFRATTIDPYSVERWSTLRTVSPHALAAADFDQNAYEGCERCDDLVVLASQGGQAAVILFVSEGDGDFPEKSKLLEPDLLLGSNATIIAKNGALFDDRDRFPDPFPDIVTMRKRNVVRVLVRDNGEGLPILELHTRPTGPTTRNATDIAIGHLPRTRSIDSLWDIVTVDASLRTVIYGYADPKKRPENDDEFASSLPGPGWRVAMGDLDGDGCDDVVAASIAPPALSVFLANCSEVDADPDGKSKPLSRPYYSLDSGVIGTNPPSILSIGNIATGFLDPDAGLGRFLVTDKATEIVIVFVNDDGLPQRDSNGDTVSESYTLIEDEELINFEKFVVTNLDGGNGDDVVITVDDGRIFLLRSLPLGSDSPVSFEWLMGASGEPASILNLAEEETLPENLEKCVCEDMPPDGQDTSEIVIGDDPSRIAECDPETIASCLRLRRLTAAYLDAGSFPDIVLPISNKLTDDYIAVLLNPGDPGTRSIRFYRGRDDPRQIAIANINGDSDILGSPALDLVIAVEGSRSGGTTAQEGKVLILFGDPENPGEFFSDIGADAPPPGYVAPLILDKPEGTTEPEFVATENNAFGFDVMARWLVLSTNEKVFFYENLTENPSFPKFGVPVEFYKGFDPEAIIVADFLGDGEADLIIADEDRGLFVVLENAINDPNHNSNTPWREAPAPFIEGRPEEMILYKAPDGRNILVAGSKLSHLEIYTQDGEAFDREVKIDFAPRGLSRSQRISGAQLEGGTFALVAIVEGRDAITRQGAVDTVIFPASDIIDKQLSRFDALGSEIFKERRIYLPEKDDGRSQLDLNGVLLGHFDGDGLLDVLIYERLRGVLLQRGSSGDSLVEDASVPLFPLDEKLVLWNRVKRSALPDDVLLATESAVYLLDPRSAEPPRETWIIEDGMVIQDVAHGWIDAADRSLDKLRLFIHAELTPQGGPTLQILSVNSADRTGRLEGELSIRATSLIGCRDINADGMDDLIVVENLRVLTYLMQIDGRVSTAAVTSPIADIEPAAIGFFDANGDDRPDVCIGSLTGTVITLLGDATGAFPQGLQSASFTSPGIQAIVPVDLDGGGRDEVIISTASGISILRSRLKDS